MEYIYGALLLHYAKQEINEENLAKVLQAAGISPDEVRIKTVSYTHLTLPTILRV